MELIVDSVLCGWTWYNVLWPSGFQLVSELQSRFSGGTGRLFLSRSEPLHRTGRRPAGAPPGESLSSRPGHCCQPVATESSVCHCRRRCCWLAGGLQAVAKDLSPVHTSNNVEATLSNATSWTILSTVSNVASTLLPFLATMSNEISSFRHYRNKLHMFNLFRLCRKDEILQYNSSTLLPFVATKSNVASTKSNVASTLLLVWTGPYVP